MTDLTTQLLEALKAIVDHYPKMDPDGKYEKRFRDLDEVVAGCPGCQGAASQKWPPSNLCSLHYSQHSRIIRDRDYDVEVRRWSEPKEIARDALEKAKALQIS